MQCFGFHIILFSGGGVEPVTEKRYLPPALVLVEDKKKSQEVWRRGDNRNVQYTPLFCIGESYHSSSDVLRKRKPEEPRKE